MTDKTEADLLPWILGGLVVAIAVVGLIVASISKDDPEVRSPKIRPAAGSVAPRPAQSQAALVATAAMPTVGIPRHVWECAVNGQKAFSDAPCGVSANTPMNQPTTQAPVRP